MSDFGSDVLLKVLCNMTKASATIRRSATIERLSRTEKIKIRFLKLAEKIFKTGSEIFRKSAGNRAENEGLPERGGPFSALPGHLETAERHGRRAYMTVQGAHRRCRTGRNRWGGIFTLSRD